MSKSKKRKTEKAETSVAENPPKRVKEGDSEYDPALAELFASSLGPTKTLGRSASQSFKPSGSALALENVDNGHDAETSSNEVAASPPVIQSQKSNKKAGSTAFLGAPTTGKDLERSSRKRTRKDAEDDVEGRYMRQLALEEARDNPGSTRRSIVNSNNSEAACSPKNGSDLESVSTDTDENGKRGEVRRHETVAPDEKAAELEKSTRTVFLANVSTSSIRSKNAKKTLLDHLTSFVSTLPTPKAIHAIESLRFRSTAFANSGLPRKAAYAKKELMETTTRSTNAYAVYTTQLAAREAMGRLNGTMILDRHLRVDSVAHPAKQDHRRCVFVGNLGFVDDTTTIDAAKDQEHNRKPRNGKEPADVEEGLWRQFGKAGKVESVRVVRDKTTRVGKGFAYVQFWDANTVEKALLFNEKKFPPMLPRILRVTRAKNMEKARFPRKDRVGRFSKKPDAREKQENTSKELRSLAGRANKLLGRAGAAQIAQGKEKTAKKATKNSNKRAEQFRSRARQKDG